MKNYCTQVLRLTVAACICLISTSMLALTEVHVATAGTLESLLTSPEKELRITGFINGTDIKYIRSLVTAGTVTSLD